MKIISTKFSAEAFWEDLVYTEASINANKLTSHMVPNIINTLGRYETIDSNMKKAVRDKAKAWANVTAADFDADMAIKNFSLNLLSSINGNRDSEIYKKYFKISPSLMARLPIIDEIKEMERISNELSKESNDKLKAHAQNLDKTSAALKQSIEEQKKVEINVSSLNNDMMQWKNDVNRLRLGLYGELLTIASNNNFPKWWAEGFFKPAPSSAHKSEPHETEETHG